MNNSTFNSIVLIYNVKKEKLKLKQVTHAKLKIY